MKIKKEKLLFLAALVWGGAGWNITMIGLRAYEDYLYAENLVLSAVIFVGFRFFIFSRLVLKHTTRITGYQEEKQFFLKFFDQRAFLMMAVMMSMGIWIRNSGVVSEAWIAVFYSGLGLALLSAGISFYVQYIRFRNMIRENQSEKKEV